MAELPTPRTPDAPPQIAPDQVMLPSGGAAGYERRDVRLKPIFYAAGGLVVAAVLIHVAMWALFERFEARELGRKASDRPLAGELRRAQPPEPRLQFAPLDDLAALRAWEEQLLTTYAVLDAEGGVVRIPIERAMELVAERGLPARKRADQPPAAAGPAAVPGDATPPANEPGQPGQVAHPPSTSRALPGSDARPPAQGRSGSHAPAAQQEAR